MLLWIRKTLVRLLACVCGLTAIAVAVLAVRGFWRCDEAGYFQWKPQLSDQGEDRGNILGSYRGGLFWIGVRREVDVTDWYGGPPREMIFASGHQAMMTQAAIGKWNRKFRPVGRMDWAGFNAVHEALSSPAGAMNIWQGVFRAVVVPDWIVLILVGWWPLRRLRAYWVLRRRRRQGLCLTCGYDVRYSAEICPECGSSLGPQRALIARATASPKHRRWIGAAALVAACAGLVWACGGLGPGEPQAASLAAGAPLSPEHAPPRISLQIAPGVNVRLALIPAGRFIMGSPPGEEGRELPEGQHEVVISKPFYMALTPVTQEQYAAVTGKKPSCYRGLNRAVDSVTGDDADAFCEKVSKRTGRKICLPTEAQWEYACRAGTTTPFNTGSKLPRDLAAYDLTRSFPSDRYDRREDPRNPMPVGSYPANDWGLYDMHGMVWQWCRDGYEAYPAGHAYPAGRVTDPVGPLDGTSRMLRGGCWHSRPQDCRSAFRLWTSSGFVRPYFGFRVAMEF